MQTEMPWFETAEDATHNAIQHSGKSPKQVAHMLWPHLKQDSAYARLMGALKTDRPEKLTADEHICIAVFCGEFDFLHYVASQCHHTQPEPVDLEDEALELDRQIKVLLEDVSKLLKRREKGQIRAVSAG